MEISASTAIRLLLLKLFFIVREKKVTDKQEGKRRRGSAFCHKNKFIGIRFRCVGIVAGGRAEKKRKRDVKKNTEKFSWHGEQRQKSFDPC